MARKIELLSPAKDLACGLEAIRHGADAVYIGAPKFGARAAAGNPLEDIRTLCDFAHIYDARVYAALNTILKEDELEEARLLAWRLYEAGADALIVQDMALAWMELPPVPLHASTQTDNRTAGKVRFLQDAGFTQVVLARELTLEEIREIASKTEVTLEAFVHGALCVSYSGRCYLSAALSGRSANRGECAQYCRLPYTLVDADGKVMVARKHLLSLRDMNRSDDLEAMMDAGISSFKIEGRLKDVSYVKNVTAWYRNRLDEVMARRPEYARSSAGECRYTFAPQVAKSFNRGFTPFYLHGRNAGVAAFDTPKSQGERVGTVKEIRGGGFAVDGIPLHNGDGLAFFNRRGEWVGFRVNKAEAGRVFPQVMPEGLRPGMELYRNYDHPFEKLLSKPSAERKIPVRITFGEHPGGFSMEMEDVTGARVAVVRPLEKVPARQDPAENIRAQLSKLGNTPFEAEDVRVEMGRPWFLPPSWLADMRREAAGLLLSCRRMRYRRELARRETPPAVFFPEKRLTYLGNVANSEARRFYEEHGVESVEPAFEVRPLPGVPLMFAKHCLRYSLGWCPSCGQGASPFKEPYFLLHKGYRLRLEFDCGRCRMLVFDASGSRKRP